MKFIIYIAPWLTHWIELVQAIIGIVTFHKITPTWDFKFICWYAVQLAKSKNNG